MLVLPELLNAPLKHKLTTFWNGSYLFCSYLFTFCHFFPILIDHIHISSILSHSCLPACGHWPFHPSPDGMATERLMKHTGPVWVSSAFSSFDHLWPDPIPLGHIATGSAVTRQSNESTHHILHLVEQRSSNYMTQTIGVSFWGLYRRLF